MMATRLVLLGLSLATLAGCSRDEATAERSSATSSPSAVAVGLPIAAGMASATLAAAAASASAAPVASASAAPAASGSAAPAASGSAAPAASGSAAPVACGEKGQPDCPLQDWMKRVANKPMLAKDAPAVAEAFDKMVPLARTGAAYANWVSISTHAPKAARAADLDAAKAACRGCHEQYKKKYKTELRTRALP